MSPNPYNTVPMSKQQLIAYAQHSRKSSKKSKKVFGIILGIVLACLLALGGCFLWFVLSLDNALSRNTDNESFSILAEPMGDQPFYVLVLGSDERIDEHNLEASQRTDVMILTRIDPKNRQVTMLSIPRDTRYELEDGTVVKINELYNIGGLEKTIQGVSELTGLPISHYALIYMSDCKEIVDELGGVEIDVQFEINNNDPETEENINVQPGRQTLNGQQAQAYAISRHDVELDQDAHRQDKIRTLIEAVIDKLFDRPATEIPSKIIALAKYVHTDLRAMDITKLAMNFATSSKPLTVYRASGPSDGGLDESVGLWLCYENPEGWANVVSVMDSGGDPSTVEY